MKKKLIKKSMEGCDVKCMKGGCPGSIYGLGFIGALVYNLMNATGFWNGVLGILKAIVWPALLVYKILGM